ncbi:MAG: hypothetical protein ACRC7N_20690, partial [Clostridium sp.]
MASEQLLVTLGVQDKGATKQINALNKELKYLDKEYKNTSKSSDKFDKTQEELGRELDILKKKYDVNASKLDVYKKKINDSREAITKKEEDLKKLKASEEDNTKAIALAEKSLGTYREQLRDAERNLSLTESEVRDLEQAMNDANVSIANFKMAQARKELELTAQKLEASAKKWEEAGSKVQSFGNKLTIGVTAPLILAGKKTFDLASDMEENLNKVQATFKQNADEIIKWSDTTLKAYGIGKGSALEYTATVGDMLNGMGFAQNQVLGLSKQIVEMSADIGSFKNAEPEEVFKAITAALTGEREQLKKYGYVINDAILQEYAHAQGIKKKLSEMSLQEKALLTLSKIQLYATDAEGDFAKTSESSANSVKIFKESAKQLGATLGTELLPMLTPVIQSATEMVQTFANMDDETRKNIVQLGLLVAMVGPVTTGVGTMMKAYGGFQRALAFATKKQAENKSVLEKMAKAQGKASTSTSLLSKATSLLSPQVLGVTAVLGTMAVGVAAVKTSNDLMAKSVTTASDDLSTFEKIVSKFNGTSFKTREELEKQGLVYKQFSSSISPEFQEQVNKSQKAMLDFNTQLKEVNFDNVLSDSEKQSLVEQVKGATDSAINAVKSKRDESNNAYKELFLSDGVISETEQGTLDMLNRLANENINSVNSLQGEINGILKNALKEKRGL